jgi:hypothetical protein
LQPPRRRRRRHRCSSTPKLTAELFGKRETAKTQRQDDHKRVAATLQQAADSQTALMSREFKLPTLRNALQSALPAVEFKEVSKLKKRETVAQIISLFEDGGFGVLDVAEQDIQGDSESSEAEAAAGEENDVDE